MLPFKMLKEESKAMKKPSVKYQFYSAIIVNIIVIVHGLVAGWPSSNIPLLTSDDTPLTSGKITMEEASWIASVMCVGGLFGNIFFGFITNAFGRKLPLLLITLPEIIGWLLILNAQNAFYLYAARLMLGFVGGGIFIILPLYLNEICSDSVRGTIGSTITFTYNMGMLLAFVLGNYYEYETTPKIAVGLTVLCFVLLYRLPETPAFLMSQGKIPETEKSIRFYQNRRSMVNDCEFIQTEIQKLKESIGGTKTDEEDENSFRWSDLFCTPYREAMTIGIVLCTLNQLCGCFAMLNYSANIFEEAGSSLSPNMSAIVIGIIQVIGSSASTFLVDIAGRKFLYIISTIGTALGLTVLGAYVFLKESGVDVEAFNYIPLASFSFTIFIASFAILSLLFLVTSEVMPVKIKDFGLSFCMALVWILSFATVKLLPFLNDNLGFHGTMFFFAGCCLLSMVFIIFYLPETKGKSYQQIMNMLR